MPRQRRYRRLSAPRKRTSWSNHTLEAQTLASGSTVVSSVLDGLTNDQFADIAGIERVIWQGQMGLFAANSQVMGRWGLVMGHEDALGNPPDPLDDHQSSWLWNEFFALDEPTVEFRQFRGQTGTKRRFRSIDDRLYLVFQSSGLSAGTLKYDIGLRTLFSHK